MEESEIYITKAIMHSGGALIYSYGGIKVSDKELKINTEKLSERKRFNTLFKMFLSVNLNKSKS